MARLPRLPKDLSLVDVQRRVSVEFQRWWQKAMEAIENMVLDLQEAIDRITTNETDISALEAVTFTAGNGLTGGGGILSNPAFAVGAGAGITVAADSVSVSAKLQAYDGGDTPSAFTLGIVDSADAAAWRAAIGAGTSSTTGTVTSVNASGGTTGYSFTGGPVTASGTLTLTGTPSALGTPASGTLTNCTGLPIATGVSGLGANVATFLATPTSANLAAAVTDEDGSGVLPFETTGTWTPTVTAGGGAITSYTATGNYTKIGRQVTATFVVTITNNGTGSTLVNVSLPFAAGSAGQAVGAGREAGTTGHMLQASVAASATVAVVVKYDNSYPGGTGNILVCTVSYFV